MACTAAVPFVVGFLWKVSFHVWSKQQFLKWHDPVDLWPEGTMSAGLWLLKIFTLLSQVLHSNSSMNINVFSHLILDQVSGSCLFC